METIWLLVALLILIAAVFRPVKRTVFGALDQRSEAIRREIDEAARLREEAQGLLRAYRKKQEEGEARAETILRRSEEEAERATRERHAELEAGLKRRGDLAARRIAQEEARAVQEVRDRAATLAMTVTRRLIARHVEGDRGRAILDRAIAEVGRKLA